MDEQFANSYLYEDLVIQGLQDAGIFTEFNQDGKNFLEAMRAQKLPALATAIKIQHQLPPLSKWQAVGA